MPRSPANALARLKAGNQRYVAGRHDADATPLRRHELVAEQEPYAIILGCSDSRVPAEMVFDQGLGSLFVIRVAGNIVAPSHIASAEYAATALGTHLIVVLGHTGCGAVKAALQELERPMARRSPGLRSITDRIRPAIENVVYTDLSAAERLERAVRVNIHTSVHTLRHGSPILETLLDSGKLVIVGAEYSLETGDVEFFDDLPSP
ncbi:MAG: carbonic anhydrase [Rubricoccaceae bacterium]